MKMDIQYIDPDDFYLSKIFSEGAELNKVKLNKESWLFSGIWIEKKGLFLKDNYPAFTITSDKNVFYEVMDSTLPKNAIFYTISPPFFEGSRMYLIVHCPNVKKILEEEWF
jgi:hypothetical protein